MKNKRVLLIGGSGFIGLHLARAFLKTGYEVRILSRSEKKHPIYEFSCWDGIEIPQEAFEGVDVIVNLSGESISGGRWTKERKKRILESRVFSVRALVKALKKIDKKPSLVIQASAVGYYGRGLENKVCTEGSPAGKGFLAEVCQAWEKEAEEIGNYTRFCLVRIGMVLGKDGGAFPELLKIYRFALGGVLGSGTQWLNWIHIKDLVRFFLFSAEDEEIKGVFNLVSPGNKQNSDLHEFLSKKTMSFRFMRVPSFALRLLLGEQSSLVLEGPRVIPKGLEEKEFHFEFDDFFKAGEDLLLSEGASLE